MIYFQNKNYKVETNADGEGYSIINTVTGMVERKEGLLPVARSLAIQMNDALEEFAKEQGKKDQKVLLPAQEILLPH